jgi:hypothetical protein
MAKMLGRIEKTVRSEISPLLARLVGLRLSAEARGRAPEAGP